LCSFFYSNNDSVAQLVEQLTLNQWVASSNLAGVTPVQSHPMGGFFIEQKTKSEDIE
jgi:hypothetical protein